MKQWIIAFLDRHCVADWRDWWKWYSTNTFNLLLAWNVLPTILQLYIPLWLQITVSIMLWPPYLLARIWDQPKLDGEE